MNTNFTSFSRQEKVALSTPTNAMFGSGAYQSTVSDSSRERYRGRQSWSTASTLPPRFVNYLRRNRRSASPTKPTLLAFSVTILLYSSEHPGSSMATTDRLQVRLEILVAIADLVIEDITIEEVSVLPATAPDTTTRLLRGFPRIWK